MEGAHIHLALNHLPIAALIFGIPALLFGIFLKNESYRKVGFTLLLVASLLAVPVYLSGEAAEEAIEDRPGVSEMIIEEHEEYAKIAFITLMLLGGLCVVGHLRFRDSEIPGWFNGSVIFVATSALFLAGNAAMHGGHIMHPEVRGDHHHSIVGPRSGIDMDHGDHGDHHMESMPHTGHEEATPEPDHGHDMHHMNGGHANHEEAAPTVPAVDGGNGGADDGAESGHDMHHMSGAHTGH